MYSAFSIDFHEPTPDSQTPINFLLVDKNAKRGHSCSSLESKEHFKFGNLIVRLFSSLQHLWLENRHIIKVIIKLTLFVSMCDVKM